MDWLLPSDVWQLPSAIPGPLRTMQLKEEENGLATTNWPVAAAFSYTGHLWTMQLKEENNGLATTNWPVAAQWPALAVERWSACLLQPVNSSPSPLQQTPFHSQTEHDGDRRFTHTQTKHSCDRHFFHRLSTMVTNAKDHFEKKMMQMTKGIINKQTLS